MGERRKYRRKSHALVTAVQLDLDTDGFTYFKWGGEQRCRARDWIVNNEGDIYTVAQDTFAETYELLSPGVYKKVAPVWAEQASKAGVVETKEGTTSYDAGDYLVFNNEDGSDAYAVSKNKFEDTYDLND
jgi:hypothetical protein